ncbi:sensor histidine kinase [Micromonospora siamensis]|uniref:histidine kinase n=1 Tax=Micromonospora siamensis TaxID=299152 RepID=A0A1C5GLZ6_9ACTN|nr:nitrate- and nitrite sensing domain-containing protein [Micromonospora siamensis]SCG34772.1 Signal transduction histidine kinase [Micromonospora siamensis]
MLARLRIRGKLALLVIIPLLSMAGLAVPVVVDRIDTARQAGAIADTVRVASRVGSLVQDLQQERLLSVGLLLGRVSRTELIQKAAMVDDRVTDLRAELGDELPGPVATALDGVRRLADLRTAVLAGAATPGQIMETYGPVDTALIDSLRLVYDVDTRTSAGKQVLALDHLLRADEGLSACATLIVLVKATKDPKVVAGFIACISALQVDNTKFRSLITREQFKLAQLDDAATAARTSPTFLTDSVRDPVGAIDPVPLDALFPSVRSMITLGQFVEKKIVADVIAEVTVEQRRALTTAWLLGGVAVAILLLVVGLSMAVARTVARPLTRLTRSADRVARVAEEELVRVADDETESAPPVRLDPVDVRAQDEIGDLARAFERVQSTAARLVERQVAGRRNVAQMFGHVGRRTQNLVGRQIALIDQLERQETDPGRLEQLYRLDHVSSRLRRNAGSLVVLSGAAGADGPVAPVPLADVVRLALGEIEDYTRVDVQVPPGVSAAPAVAGDLVLVLAELMENATVFSPPHTRVVVGGELTETGARLSVVDRGIGMTEERLAEENARLTRRERLDLAPTEVLGLFVVGRLARRHGLAVELVTTGGGGVTARLEIPAALLVIRQADREGATVARATVPARDRRSPIALDAARPGRALTSAPERRSPAEVALPAGFDPDLLDRATRSMADGRPWDAFGSGGRPDPAPAGPAAAPLEPLLPSAAGTAEPPMDPYRLAPANPVAAPVDPYRPAPVGVTEPLPRRTATAPAGDTVPLTLTPATTAFLELGTPATPAAPAGPASAFRQRVPGASLPPAGPAARPVGGTAADPAAARALVEEFQSGVRRAEQRHPGSWPPAPAAAPPPVATPLVTAPVVASPTATTPLVTAPAAAPTRPRLSRRVPGANLAVSPHAAPPPVSSGPGDPAQVRDLITEFEAGVARALREVSPGPRNEEGSSR